MLSRRAKEKNAWFLKAFERPMQRQSSPSANNIDLATAENWLIRPEVLSLLRRNCKNLKAEDLSYESGLGGTAPLLEALAGLFNAFFEPKLQVRPEHIVTGAGLSGLLDSLIHDICDNGDGLLVSAPFWGSFQVSAVLRNSVKLIPVYVPIHESGSAGAIVASYRAAAEQARSSLSEGARVRGILFCNPHNPHGHLCPADVLDGLLRFCQDMDLHFVSDEIYALSSFASPTRVKSKSRSKPVPVPVPVRADRGLELESPTRKFVSVLSRDLEHLGVSPSRVHTLYSISKDLGCSGLRLGCLVTQSNKALRLSQAIHNKAKLCTATTVMMLPVLQQSARMRTLIDLNVRRLRRAAGIAVAFAEFHGLTYYEPVAGLYIWLRLSRDYEHDHYHDHDSVEVKEVKAQDQGREAEEAIVERCAKAGVLVGSGGDYAAVEAGWFRLTFSLPEGEFLEGLRRVEEAMGYQERFSSSKSLSRDMWRRFICL